MFFGVAFRMVKKSPETEGETEDAEIHGLGKM